MNTTALKKEYKGNVGLFLVCLEISKMNLIALPTSRNTKGLDLIALHPETNKAIGLQVKCSDKKKSPILASYWHNYKETIQNKIISPFIFVDISVLEKPQYFILSKTQITRILTKLIEDYIKDYTQRNGVTFEDICTKEQLKDKDKDKNKNADNWVLNYDQFAAYLNKWDSITNLIK
ncbi:MAG: hypothetical protein NTW44_05600 [Nitrospirae bacterium]|nr:hypothetical protein [Nitrospirota bacterium]